VMEPFWAKALANPTQRIVKSKIDFFIIREFG